MAKSAKIQSPKKELKNQVITHLQGAIEYLRAHLSEKEFRNRIEKTAKLLTEGIKNKDLKKTSVKSAKEKLVKKELVVDKDKSTPIKEDTPKASIKATLIKDIQPATKTKNVDNQQHKVAQTTVKNTLSSTKQQPKAAPTKTISPAPKATAVKSPAKSRATKIVQTTAKDTKAT